MSIKKLWPTALELLHALNAHYGPAMDAAAAEQGLPPGQWGLLLTAGSFAPDDVSPRRLAVRNPYTAQSRFRRSLEDLAAAGLLEETDTGSYSLTQAGYDATVAVVAAAYSRMSALQPLMLADLERLAAALRRVVEACLTAPEPPGRWSLGYSRRTDPGEKSNVVVRIDQYLTDLAAYRDDAHLAAWQSYGVSGPAWEALTLLWRGETETLGGILSRLEYRGHPREVYEEALAGLTARGWLREDSGYYRLTDQGQNLRLQAEEGTDAMFYRPWEVLNPAEQDRLRQYLARMRDALNSLAH